MKSHRSLWTALRILLGTLLACFVSATSATATDGLRGVALGDPFPTYELKSANEAVIAPGDFQGKLLVVVYLSAKQNNSEQAAIAANNVVKQLANKNVKLLFVTADVEHADSFAEQWKKNAIEAPLGFDRERALYGKLGLIVFPTTMIVGRDGKLAHVILTRRTNYSHVLDAYIRHGLGLLNDEGLTKQLESRSLDRASPRTLAARHRAAARLMREKGLADGAEQELKIAIELDPQNVHVRLDLADLYVHGERLKEAEALALAILEKDPKQRQAHLILGMVYFKQKRLDESEGHLLDALLHNPDPARTHYFLGQVYEQKGETKKALQHYRDSLKRVFEE